MVRCLGCSTCGVLPTPRSGVSSGVQGRTGLDKDTRGPTFCPVRLVVQDSVFSARRPEFDSPTGYYGKERNIIGRILAMALGIMAFNLDIRHFYSARDLW